MKKLLVILLCLLTLAGTVFAGGSKDTSEGAPGSKTVSVLAVWGGQELDAFNRMIEPFTKETGITIDYEGTRDIDAILTTRIQAGNPPDIAGLPGPGKMIELSRSGALQDLSTVFDMNELRKNYAQGWLDMASVDGKLVGIFMKTSIKGLIWYNVRFQRQNNTPVPKTWDELMALSKRIADSGITPWSIGIESGAASGWVGTDWIENIFLRQSGPQKYKDWYEGRLAWTSPEMRQAWQTWGQIVGDEKMIYGGRQYVLSTNFGQAPGPLFMNPPKAVFHQQASFIQSFINEMYPSLQPVQDFDFFAFPPIRPEHSKTLEAAGDLFGMFKRTDASSRFINFLASTNAQTQWVRLSGALSANRNVPASAYPDAITRKSAEILQGAEDTVFDASDMMPGEMNAAFWTAVVNFVENPRNLDRILNELESVRRSAYNR